MHGTGVSVTAYAAHCEWASRPPDGASSTWPASGAGMWVRRFQDAWTTSLETVRASLDADTASDRTMLLRSITRELGPTREAVVEAAVQRLDLPQKQAAEAYTLAEQHEASPCPVWGYAQGPTRLSQRTGRQDGRFTLDRAASRLLTTVH